MEIDMSPKGYNTLVALKDAKLNTIYRSHESGMVIRVGTYDDGRLQFAYGSGLCSMDTVPLDDDTFYAQDEPTPALPEGAVKLNSLKLREVFTTHQHDVVDITWSNLYFVTPIQSEDGIYCQYLFGDVKDKFPCDTPVYPVEATFRAKGACEPVVIDGGPQEPVHTWGEAKQVASMVINQRNHPLPFGRGLYTAELRMDATRPGHFYVLDDALCFVRISPDADELAKGQGICILTFDDNGCVATSLYMPPDTRCYGRAELKPAESKGVRFGDVIVGNHFVFRREETAMLEPGPQPVSVLRVHRKISDTASCLLHGVTAWGCLPDHVVYPVTLTCEIE